MVLASTRVLLLSHNLAGVPVYDFISVAAARTNICWFQAQVLHSGIVLDQAYDVSHSSCGSIEFWPFWNSADSIMSWQAQNATAITLGGVDGAVFPDIFVYGYQTGLYFDQSAIAAGHFASKIVFSSVYTDCTAIPISSPNVVGQGYYQ